MNVYCFKCTYWEGDHANEYGFCHKHSFHIWGKDGEPSGTNRKCFTNMNPKWTFAIDLDGILCIGGPVEKYGIAKPIIENINKVNMLYDKGYNIIIYTARSWGHYDLTKSWLKSHKVKYTELVMGKVLAHYYIDDHNGTLEEVCTKFCGVDDTG